MSMFSQVIPLARAEALRVEQRFVPYPESADTFAALRDGLPWAQYVVQTPGGPVRAPRLECFLGTDDWLSYTYSGSTYSAHRWDAYPVVERLANRVYDHLGVCFNAVFCNLYRDGNDSIGWHADDEPSLGPTADVVIASVSFGATRQMSFKRNGMPHAEAKIDLHDGSLLYMGHRVQSEYIHQIPKTKKPVGMRINLTFRRILA